MKGPGVLRRKPRRTASGSNEVVPRLPAVNKRTRFLISVFRIIDGLRRSDRRCLPAAGIGTRVERQRAARLEAAGLRIERKHFGDFDDAEDRTRPPTIRAWARTMPEASVTAAAQSAIRVMMPILSAVP